MKTKIYEIKDNPEKITQNTIRERKHLGKKNEMKTSNHKTDVH